MIYGSPFLGEVPMSIRHFMDVGVGFFKITGHFRKKKKKRPCCVDLRSHEEEEDRERGSAAAS